MDATMNNRGLSTWSLQKGIRSRGSNSLEAATTDASKQQESSFGHRASCPVAKNRVGDVKRARSKGPDHLHHLLHSRSTISRDRLWGDVCSATCTLTASVVRQYRSKHIVASRMSA